jgi:hypothetical protein
VALLAFIQRLPNLILGLVIFTIMVLGITIFASIVYLKSYKLSILKNALLPKAENGRKNLGEITIGVSLIAILCIIWLLWVAIRSTMIGLP